MKKCLPIVATSTAQVTQVLARYERSFDAFEVWLDYLEDLKVESVSHLLAESEKELLFLFRRKNLDPSKTKLEDQKMFIDAVQDTKAVWDFDITIQEEQVAHFRTEKRKSKLLCSYHNYSRTPGRDELEAFEKRMAQYEPDSIKFACFCQSMRETLRLLEFQLDLQQKGKRSIVLGMGEKGIITRIFGREFGNEYTFVSLSGGDAPDDLGLEPTAPGQLSLGDLDKIERILERIKNGGK